MGRRLDRPVGRGYHTRLEAYGGRAGGARGSGVLRMAVVADPVATCARCGAPVEAEGATLCARCAGASAAGQPAAETDPLVGKELGDFEVLARLGGSPGAVYRVHQRSLDRVIVLKTLPEGLAADEDAIGRLRREAETAASVDHPSVAAVHWVGSEAGRPFLAMEYVAGATLAELIAREERLAAPRVAPWLRQMAEVVAAAHAAGILLCNIEPSNVIVTADDGLRLVGFSRARRRGAVRRASPGDATLYYAPEAVRGRALDERTDLYLLGATFYHALAGRPPFEGATARQRAAQYARKEAPPLGKAAPGAPVGLCRIVHRLLRRRPVARYQSAAELLEALDRLEGAGEEGAAQRTAAALTRAERREARRRAAAAEPLTLAERAEARKRQEKQVALICAAVFGVILVILVVLLVSSC